VSLQTNDSLQTDDSSQLEDGVKVSDPGTISGDSDYQPDQKTEKQKFPRPPNQFGLS
jgi:hypothetical protein